MMINLLSNIWKDQRGQDMTEYALIAGLLTSVTCALVPEMALMASNIIGVLQAAADTAMHAAGLE
jgi:Flp pilus assembly pilin Flp